MKKRLIVLLAAAIMSALAAGTAGSAFAGDPHAGNSGKFQGSANPCGPGSNNPHCPPHGG